MIPKEYIYDARLFVIVFSLISLIMLLLTAKRKTKPDMVSGLMMVLSAILIVISSLMGVFK